MNRLVQITNLLGASALRGTRFRNWPSRAHHLGQPRLVQPQLVQLVQTIIASIQRVSI
jgi:hypothetical protein